MKKDTNSAVSGGKMLKKVLLLSTLLLFALALAIIGINYLTSYLFLKIPWLLAVSVFLGVLTGGLTSKLKNKSLPKVPAGQVKRHNTGSFLEHWGTAAGIFLLMLSGLLLHGNPSLFQTTFHFLGLFLALFFGSYFLADFFASKKYFGLLPNLLDIFDGTIKKYLFRAKWNDNGKYLSSQKSAFLLFTTFGIGISVTGLIKIAGLLWRLPPELVKISTLVHDITSVLFAAVVFIHILLVLTVAAHRRLLRSWFTGTVPDESRKIPTPDPPEKEPGGDIPE
jgi:cytochrome b subunit of formate dehydrogenase